MIITIILIITSIILIIKLLTPKTNVDRFHKKKNHEIYVDDEKLISSEPIRYHKGSPGETSRVLTKSYYTLFHQNRDKSNQAALEFLKCRNESYGSYTGNYLENEYLNFVTNKYHKSVSTLIFFICLHETYSEKLSLYDQKFVSEIFNIILEEHNKICPINEEETNDFTIEKYQKIKDAYELIRSFSNLENTNHIKSSSTENLDFKSENEYGKVEKTKLQISLIFYQFCFSDYTAKVFLLNNSMTESISKGLKISSLQLQKINILESIFKINLKKNHGIELGEGSSGFYTLNGFKFFLNTQRISIENFNSYFEILYNNFEDVKDEEGNEMSIAKEFILYVKNFEPKAIFVLVFDAILETYALRRVTQDGVSFKLTFLQSNEGSESIDFLKNYILNNNL